MRITVPFTGLLALLLVALTAPVAADVVVIPPTDSSNDPDQQRQNSIATLYAFHDAVDQAPSQGRTIQLLPGLYDFSALIIIDPTGDPPEHYSVATVWYYDGVDWIIRTLHYFNPYNLEGKYPYEDAGAGVAILGKQHLTITGALSDSGTPLSVLRGCADPECSDLNSPFIFYNIGFSIGGDFEIPSRFVKFEHLSFEDFSYAFNVDSDEPHPGWGVSDPRFGEGTEDLVIENNVFTNVVENFFGRKQIRLTIRDNDFIWNDPEKWNVHIALLGQPNERHPVDAIIEDNRFYGTGSVAILLLNRHTDTIVRDNHVELIGSYSDGIGVLGGDHGVHPVITGNGFVQDNSIDGGGVGIWIYGNSGWEIRDNTVHNADIGVWTEWGPFLFHEEGIFQPTVAQGNLVIDNDLQFNFVGVFIGARARENTYHDNDVRNNPFAGYLLNGPEEVAGIIFGPPSGNQIIGADPESVVDWSGCYPGPGGCPQIDEDNDGQYSEDPVDNINNDGDVIDGYSLHDEDLEEIPNIFIAE